MKMKKKIILLTGCAGFIGAKTCEKLLDQGYFVVGIDNMNDYYDVSLKRYRLTLLKNHNKSGSFVFQKMDIENLESVQNLFKKYQFNAIVNLAARAGVRYSMENPFIYLSTNTKGTLNLLECCKDYKVLKFVLASTSSLYAGQKMPFRESLSVNTPISPYAASKKAAESMCYTYHHLYGLDVTILRYFTVYGPAGRPDMSPYIFIERISKGEAIDVYGDGNQKRDFTYVDDIADGTVRALKKSGFKIINLGGNRPYRLSDLILLIEKYVGRQAKINYYPFNKADMMATWANVKNARSILLWQPKVDLQNGVKRTVEWYVKFCGRKGAKRDES